MKVSKNSKFLKRISMTKMISSLSSSLTENNKKCQERVRVKVLG
jgi:hypothetical protein